MINMRRVGDVLEVNCDPGFDGDQFYYIQNLRKIGLESIYTDSRIEDLSDKDIIDLYESQCELLH